MPKTAQDISSLTKASEIRITEDGVEERLKNEDNVHETEEPPPHPKQSNPAPCQTLQHANSGQTKGTYPERDSNTRPESRSKPLSPSTSCPSSWPWSRPEMPSSGSQQGSQRPRLQMPSSFAAHSQIPGRWCHLFCIAVRSTCSSTTKSSTITPT